MAPPDHATAEAPTTTDPSPKCQQILDGARRVFLEAGFEGASVDEIARAAGVSKGTMYNYFPDKRALFVAMIRQVCAANARKLFVIERSTPEDVAASLRRFARTFVPFILSPFAQQVYRTAVGESQRFPELGRVFYEAGPALGIRRVAAYLSEVAEAGLLAITDPELAAHQLMELTKAPLFHRVVFGLDTPPTAAEITAAADAAVDTFLRAYRHPGNR